MYGEDIKKIQKRLISLGYSELGDADGWYGPLSKTALKYFQFESDIYPSGIVDKDTWNKLFSGDIIICAYAVYNNKHTPSYDLTGETESFWNGTYRGKKFEVNGKYQMFLFNLFDQEDILKYPIKFKIVIPDNLRRKGFAGSFWVKIFFDKYFYETRQDYLSGEGYSVLYENQYNWIHDKTSIYTFTLPNDVVQNQETFKIGCFPLMIKIFDHDTVIAEDVIKFLCGE